MVESLPLTVKAFAFLSHSLIAASLFFSSLQYSHSIRFLLKLQLHNSPRSFGARIIKQNPIKSFTEVETEKILSAVLSTTRDFSKVA